MRSSVVIVVPVFNEIQRFDIKYWEEILSAKDVGLIFVNDGSSDGSKEMLDNSIEYLSKVFPSSRSTVIHLNRNYGKSYAVQTGIKAAYRLDENPQTLVFLDSDGAFLSSEILEKINNYKYIQICNASEIHCGLPYFWSSRVALSGTKIDRKLSRHYLNRIIMTILCWGMPVAPYDSQAGFKIFPACHHVLNLFNHSFRTKWLFDLELYMRINELNLLGLNNPGRSDKKGVIEFPIQYWRDVPGSKISLRTYLPIFIEVLVLLKIKRSNREF